MKLLKKTLSTFLALIMLVQCSEVAVYAETSTPQMNFSSDGAVYTYNDDGTITVTIYPSGGSNKKSAPTASEDDRIEDQGDSYVNTSEDVTVTLEKTYTDGDVLVSVESDGTGIVFYPETVAGAIPVEMPADEAREEASAPAESEALDTNKQSDNGGMAGFPAVEDETADASLVPQENTPSEQHVNSSTQEAVDEEQQDEDPVSADESSELGELAAVSRSSSIRLAPPSIRRPANHTARYSASTPGVPEQGDTEIPDETPEPTEVPLPAPTPDPTDTPAFVETPEATENPAPTEPPKPADTLASTEEPTELQEQNAPEAPKAEAVSPNCIKVLDPQADQEYSINNGLTWVTADENSEVRFENLMPETEYEVITRKLGNDAFLPSPASAPAKVTTPAETPEATPEPTETPLPTPEPTSTPEPTPTPTPLPSETPAVTAEPEPQYEPAAVYDSVDGVGVGYAQGTYAGVLYPGAINEFTDVELIPTGNGVKENIIMRRYTTSEISYVLDFSGLSPVLSGNTVLLYDASGEKVGEISAPYLVDANRAYNKDIGVSLDHIVSGYRLTYTMDESWLMAAAYPVTLDPTVSYDVSNETWRWVEDNHVSPTNPNHSYSYTDTYMYSGIVGGTEYISYIRPAFYDSLMDVAGNTIIKNVTLYTYVTSTSGSGRYSLHNVTGGEWRSNGLKYANAPACSGEAYVTKTISSAGWVQWDVTEAASTWFNALDQKGNFGFAITCDNHSNGTYARFASSDATGGRGLYYSITYYAQPSTPALTVTPQGNGVNSGTGYLDLSWSAATGAEAYYVGLFNGKAYEYFFVGNTTSWTTKGKGIWPTESEISGGRYLLHHDGAGAELPMIPAFSYAKANGSYGNDLYYYVRIVPANRYRQAVEPQQHNNVKSARLPDTLPPSTASSLSVSPDTYTNANTVTLNWSGIRDFNATDTQAVASLGSGRVQYSLNSTGSWINTASSSGDGSASIDVSSIPDGQNVVYLRAVDSAGNTGTPQPVYFFIDRTPPTAPTISIVPDGWSKDGSLSLTWSGINDLNELARVELSFDGGAYFSTGRTEPAYSGHMVDLSSLPDGEHTLSVRGVDIAGNNGEAATVTFFRDTTAPTTAGTSVDPDSWTNSDEVTFGWTQLEDIHSGLKLVWYRVNGGEQISLDAEEDLTTSLDVSALDDGEHTILLHFEDQVGNSAEHSLSVFRDVTKPELALLSPADGSAVNGTVEVLGSVRDLSLDTWRLTATGENGEARTLAVGSAEKDTELLGILNCALYTDGEKVELKLYAIDKAGNENEVTGTVIVVDKSAKPISGTVTITSPANNEQLTAPDTTGSYTTSYEQPETEGLLYIDGVYQGTTKDKTFVFDTITYEENSVHSLSVLSRASDGTVQFSQGVYNYVLHSDAFEDNSFLSSHSGIAFHYGASLDGAASGTLISQPVTPAFPVLSLRLSVTEDKPAGTEIQYCYSTDSGETWTSISPETDVPMLSRPETVMLKAELTGDGTSTPTLYGMTLQGVIEMEPTRVIVKLLRPVEQIALADTTATQAITPLAEAPEAAEQLRQYQNGAYVADSFSYDARGVAENESRRVALTAETKDHVLHGTGAKTSILLRENITASGTVTSGALKADGSLYAIRLEALYSGGTSFSYSTDGTSWASLMPGAYTYLDKPADAVYVRAQGGTLRAWHVEGVTCAESTVTVRIMQAPANVTAADWGADYYANEKLRYYDLSWTEPTPEDTTAAYTTAYELYRNGALIATTAETRYRDNNYVANARYEVRTLRTYAGFEARPSERSAAVRTSMKAPERVIGVSYTAEEQKQSEYLNRLYGGNYTFSGQPNAPTDGHALNRGLLGRNKMCAYGFEPVNFNTGNFLLETSDMSLANLGLASFALDRTYNAQSEAANGPFGSRWSSKWSEHLLLYTEGDVTYTKADGAELVFHRRANGSYYGGEAYGLTLIAEGGEYRVTDLGGETHAFTGMGLLKHVQWSDGSRITVERNEDGLLTAFVLPSGETLAVENDKYGHITAVETPSGTLRYTYSGNLLTKFTAADGSETRYVYDGSGRMTEWYDTEGARQVKNTYDKEGRVTRQLDANGGEYRLEYYDDHTVTTDADGNTSEIWFDAQKRTTKTVDANGGEISYTYDQNSNIIAITDALGNATRYEYDAFGNKVKETAPDGSSCSLQYDANNNLIQLTDQRGGVTRYEYDAHNRLVRQLNPDGGVIAYTYNEAGQVLTVTDPLGHVTAYEYDGVDLVRSTDPNGNATSYAYDEQHRLVSTTDALGNTTSFAYDERDNLTSVTFADGTSFAYEYDKVGDLISQTDALGNVTRFEYDALRQLVKTVYPDGSESTSTYDHSGNIVSAVDALGGEAAAAYDGRGKLLTLTDALGNTTSYAYDLGGNLLSETLANGAKTQYSYTPTGQLASVTNAAGEQTSYAYDAAGSLTGVTAPDGGVTRYGYDAMGRLISETDPKGATTTYAYDKAGQLVSKTDALGSVTAYAYDPNGNLLTITDALGGVTHYAYDALNRVISMTDANGATTSYAYDAVGNLVTQTDALGNVTTYAYDGNGSITGLTDALGGRRAMTYDALGNVISVLQKNSGTVSAEYDPLGHLLKETDALGNATGYEYDLLGRVTKITDALGQSAAISYDETGSVTRIDAPDGSSTGYAYDLAGRLTTETAANGAKTLYDYDSGRLVSTTVNGSKTAYTYDLAGNITSVTDAEGRKLGLRYDALGNLTGILYPDGTQDSYEYDALSRLVKYTPRLGDATEYAYNAMGDVISVTVGGQTTGYEYDLLGRTTAVITADGARTEVEYDALGNTVKTVDALGNATSYGYTVDSLLREIRYANGATLTAKFDLAGNMISETDPEGNTTAYEYDPVGRMTAVTDALGNTTRYDYDAADNLTRVTDALGHVTSYTYDALGNLTSETDALGNTVKYSYTPEGWLETVTDAEGHVTRYSYDKTGNTLSADYAGEQTETNTYNELGLLTTVTTAEGDTLYQYDEASRLISVTQPSGDTVSYTYDSHGNRSSMTYPNGKTVSYSYDEMNRLVSVKGVDGETTKYSYDALGRRIATDGAKENTTYSYDEVGNLVSQTTTGAYDLALEYAYDLSGRMTSESRTENGATLTSSYLYDALGQLTSFTRSDGQSETYTYDPVGNMTAKTQNGVSTTMRYNAANQLIQSVTGGETTKYAYDANGNLTRSENAGGARSYAYNALNLLESFTREDGYTENYSYNANRLLSEIRTSEDLTTSLTWDILYGDGVVISAAQNGQTTNYTYGLERISALTGKTRTEYVYDGRGSVAAEVSYNDAWYTFGGGLARKNVVSKSYSPFGELLTEQTSGFGYNGEYYNAATGMIYLRARFYEPEMNRFGQKDLLRGSAFAPQSLNRYLYCWNDPINYVDPSGQLGLLAGTAIAAGICGLVAGATSAYQSYKSTGKVDWKQAGKAAAGGALAAVAVGVAVATGGTGLGVATMAVEAIAGGRTALRGGTVADVTTTMAKAGTMTVVAGNVLPVLPNAAKAVVGTIGVVRGVENSVNATKKASETLNNPNATTADKIVDVADAGLSYIGTLGSALYAYSGINGMISDAKAVSAARQSGGNSVQQPEVEGGQASRQTISCGKTASRREDGYFQDINGRWHRPNGQFASNSEVGIESSSSTNTSTSYILRRNLVAAGIEEPPYPNAAHHIVAENAPAAADSTAILKQYNVDINDPANGVFLPTQSGVTDAAYHPSLHTKEYYETVNSLLKGASSREDVINILKYIGEALQKGTFIK